MNNRKGFTLIEVIVVLVILAILAAFTIPTMFGYISNSQEKLCDITRLDMVRLYKTSLINQESSASKAGFESFVKENWGSLSQCPSGGVYTFEASSDADGEITAEIQCSIHDATKVLTSAEIKMGTGNDWWKSNILDYIGSATDIIIPTTLNGTTIKNIYQGAFKDSSLTAVSFENDSQLTQIHRQAFINNNLTEIEFPDSVTRIDGLAFYNNNITKITIGGNVAMEEKVFANNDDFKTFYTTGGRSAGTYIFADGAWKKQE
ncbi:leucine-rich repeat protein [Acetobacterium sp.]|jgi:prepilin-type N-terminal cleavage/methylation domain-containing protein|uniref:leucine-rich repeat protein n=1 Tax=Acetobacterium sp. TaxID=1872094 RepID=UPI000CAC1F44|nr:leucine-rich repeat protein [Acetobacterium sp.]MDO9492804.1 leucine-rich repeat protein [Acetobacterium sp.]PKM73457.1 MAG: hypothetical protein CVU92_06640 [Firmicutes bacterium HGW-Firmicutes-17]